jgi:uncharacterized membrane protein required for colicin V production
MWFDALIVGILVIAVWRGAVKGFVWQVAAIASIVLCFAFAESVSLVIAPHIKLEPPLNRWVAMFGLYAAFSFGTFGAARLLRGWLEKLKFEQFDRHLGSVFGLVKGIAFALVVTFFVVTMSESTRETVMNTYSGRAAAIVMDRMHPVMPAELHAVLEPYIHQLDQPGLPLHAHDGDEHGHGSHGHDDHSHGSAGDRDELLEFVKQLPGVFDEDLRQRALKALENTSPEHRSELKEKLSSKITDLVRQAAEAWENGKPNAGPAANPAERSRLLQEISAVYTNFPPAQSDIVEEIQTSLRGLPDQVADRVVRDWHADLMAINPDPDPQTDITTPLDVRIVRQLAVAKLPLSTLSTTLQDRLRGIGLK